MLKEEMDAAAQRHQDVTYEPQLIDATFALLVASAGDPMVIPALNRDGDILSDLVLPLFGSIAGSESLLVAGAALLSHGDSDDSQQAGRAIREACLETVAQGVRTADLQGHATTTEFTDAVIARTKTKLEAWATL